MPVLHLLLFHIYYHQGVILLEEESRKFLAHPTSSNVAPRAKQKTRGPVRSVSFIMLPSAGFIGFRTVKVFCHICSKLIPSSAMRNSTTFNCLQENNTFTKTHCISQIPKRTKQINRFNEDNIIG